MVHPDDETTLHEGRELFPVPEDTSIKKTAEGNIVGVPLTIVVKSKELLYRRTYQDNESLFHTER